MDTFSFADGVDKAYDIIEAMEGINEVFNIKNIDIYKESKDMYISISKLSDLSIISDNKLNIKNLTILDTFVDIKKSNYLKSIETITFIRCTFVNLSTFNENNTIILKKCKNLKGISKLKSVKKLIINGCNIRNIYNLSGIYSLTIINCELNSIKIDDCEILYVEDSSIYYFQNVNVKTLTLRGIDWLRDINISEKTNYCDFSNCNNLSEITGGSNLTSLIINHTNLQNLPLMPNLTDIELIGTMINNESVNSILNIYRMVIDAESTISDYNRFNNLTELTIYGYRGEKIPHIPSLLNIYIYNSSIKSLENLENIRNIKIFNCRFVTDITPIINADTIEIRNCPITNLEIINNKINAIIY